MPTTSLFSPFRRIHQGVASVAETRRLLSRHDPAPMSVRHFTGILHTGEWFELDEASARTLAGRFIGTLNPGGFIALPTARPEQIHSVLFSLLERDRER